MSNTVTVLYFDDDSLMLSKAVLHNLPAGAGGRIILPDAFRHGKSIVAVLRGEAEVLNMVGERAFMMEQSG
ncbi:TIGR02922 family protein [Ferrimonas senticii]|uniref:TIGR02922 family protein n=1 Tax=Ferrimonas senticii TaxID=394566 RepID=UPI000408F491|nr:TIGR02922 family protein [Ferrimonas senticii]